MNDFLRALLGLLAAVAPLGAVPTFFEADVPPQARSRAVAIMCLAAFVVLAAAVFVAEPLLDWLEISPENFQLAAGAIMLPQAFHLLWRGRTLSGAEPGVLVPLAVPLLAGPASVAAAMAYGSRFGEAEAVAASAVVLAAIGAVLSGAEAVREHVRPVVLETLARFNGGLLTLIAIEMIIDGVRSV